MRSVDFGESLNAMKNKSFSLLSVMAACAVIALTSGCSTTSLERINADGSKSKATNKRAIWNSKGVDIQFESAPDGTIKASAKIDQSGSDAAALVEAATRGAIQGLKGQVPANPQTP